LGEYDKLTTTYDAVFKQMGIDTVNGNYVEMLRGQAIMADARGDVATGRNFWRRYAELYRVLNDSLQKSKAYQYAAHYHAQEQQMEIELKEEALRRMHMYIVVAVLLALLAVSFAFYFFYRGRIDRKKNMIIVNQISEAVKLNNLAENKSSGNSGVQGTGVEQQEPTSVELNDMSNEELYTYLSTVIIREQLFLNPSFDRQSVVTRFRITEKRVGAAFSKGSDYKSLPGFVREQRLLYACKLLHDNLEMSVKEVAAASGFSSQPRFNIDFKERFSFSPLEYRRLLSEKSGRDTL